MKLYLLVSERGEYSDHVTSFNGIFDSREKAVEAIYGPLLERKNREYGDDIFSVVELPRKNCPSAYSIETPDGGWYNNLYLHIEELELNQVK
jgi:hypothetical protein